MNMFMETDHVHYNVYYNYNNIIIFLFAYVCLSIIIINKGKNETEFLYRVILRMFYHFSHTTNYLQYY